MRSQRYRGPGERGGTASGVCRLCDQSDMIVGAPQKSCFSSSA